MRLKIPWKIYVVPPCVDPSVNTRYLIHYTLFKATQTNFLWCLQIHLPYFARLTLILLQYHISN